MLSGIDIYFHYTTGAARRRAAFDLVVTSLGLCVRVCVVCRVLCVVPSFKRPRAEGTSASDDYNNGVARVAMPKFFISLDLSAKFP